MYIGIDVSKSRLDVARADLDAIEQYNNDKKGVRTLIKRLVSESPNLVVMESTGGYERRVAKSLHEHGIPVAVMNPWQTYNFAKSLGNRAKTDALDARVLAKFGEVVNPRITSIIPDADFELKQLVLRRVQLVRQKVQEKNRLEHGSPLIRTSIRKMIKILTSEIAQVTSKIEKMSAKNASIVKKSEQLQSAKGIGTISALSILLLLPELGNLNRKQIAALVGVAPYNRDSGNKTGQRSISGGRSEVRAVLYMATLTAIRCNPKIRSFYKKLLSNGKKKKVALIACARKFLVCLNAMLKSEQCWHDGAESAKLPTS